MRAAAYELDAQSAFILEASESGSVGTVLLYISGFHETGGGGSYEKVIVYSCATVQVDLEQHEVTGYEPADCTASIYAVNGSVNEIDFDEIARAADIQ